MKTEQAPKSVMRYALNFIYIAVFLMVLAGVWLGPITPSYRQAVKSAAMQTARAIGGCLYQYSLDHNGHYLEGKTSTEVFQQLLEGNYVTDPSLFYVARIPGKIHLGGHT